MSTIIKSGPGLLFYTSPDVERRVVDWKEQELHKGWFNIWPVGSRKLDDDIMAPQIWRTIHHYKTSYDSWEKLEKSYAHRRNVAKIY